MALEILESVTSTMDVAREKVLAGRVTFDAAGLPTSEGVMAREQTAGRGQRGRIWYSPPGDNLYVTYYLRHQIVTTESAGQISLLVGVSVADVLQGIVSRRLLSADTQDNREWYEEYAASATESGVPFVDFTRFTPDAQTLQRIPASVAQRLKVLPVKQDPDKLFVAMSNVNDLAMLDELRLLARQTIYPVLAVPQDLQEALNRCYGETPTDAAQEQRSAPLQPVGLKWPNDVLLNGKKAGGILIEMVKAPDNVWTALVGIGINIGERAFPPELSDSATSLALEGVPYLDWQVLGQKISNALQHNAETLRETSFTNLLERWRKFDQTSGRAFQAQWNGEMVQGIAEGVDDTGALLLRLGDGRLISVQSASSLQETPRNE